MRQLVRPSDTSRQQKKLQNMQNNSATQPVYSIANTELGSIGRMMRRARGSRPSPPPPLQLKFQQRAGPGPNKRVQRFLLLTV
jgi:hypothetical protein